MNWPTLKRLGWALLIFGVGVTVGGSYPVWVKIGYPSLCVLWLIAYDELYPERLHRKQVRQYFESGGE